MFAFLGGDGTMLFIAALYIASSLALLLVKPARKRSEPKEKVDILRSSLQGMRYVFKNPTLRALAVTYWLFQMAWGALTLGVPAYRALEKEDGDAFDDAEELGRRVAELLPLWLGRPLNAGPQWQRLMTGLVVNPEALKFFNTHVFNSYSASEHIGAVVCPTLILGGELDPYGGPEHVQAFAQILPHAHAKVLARAGHMAHVGAVEDVRDAVVEFLDEVAVSERE